MFPVVDIDIPSKPKETRIPVDKVSQEIVFENETETSVDVVIKPKGEQG